MKCYSASTHHLRDRKRGSLNNKEIVARLGVIERSALSLAATCRELMVEIVDSDPDIVVRFGHEPETVD